MLPTVPPHQAALDERRRAGRHDQLAGLRRQMAANQRAKWIAPRFERVDPLKDRQAEKLAVDSGFKAGSDVVEAEGYDREETPSRSRRAEHRDHRRGC